MLPIPCRLGGSSAGFTGLAPQGAPGWRAAGREGPRWPRSLTVGTGGKACSPCGLLREPDGHVHSTVSPTSKRLKAEASRPRETLELPGAHFCHTCQSHSQPHLEGLRMCTRLRDGGLARHHCKGLLAGVGVLCPPQ